MADMTDAIRYMRSPDNYDSYGECWVNGNAWNIIVRTSLAGCDKTEDAKMVG